MWDSVPDERLNPSPCTGSQGVLTTGLPRRSLLSRFLLGLGPRSLPCSCLCHFPARWLASPFPGERILPWFLRLALGDPLPRVPASRTAQLSHRAQLPASTMLVGPVPAPQGPLPTPLLPPPPAAGGAVGRTVASLDVRQPWFVVFPFLVCDLGQVTSGASFSFCF